MASLLLSSGVLPWPYKRYSFFWAIHAKVWINGEHTRSIFFNGDDQFQEIINLIWNEGKMYKYSIYLVRHFFWIKEHDY